MKPHQIRWVNFIPVSMLVVIWWAFAGSQAMANPVDATIHGVVTDAEGKPIRGAAVKVALGTEAISRFTDQNGRYQITGLQAGSYRITVQAYGFETKSQTRDSAQSGETSFLLMPHWNIAQLSSAELMTALPKNEETRFLAAMCTGCHTLTPMLLKRGITASEWDGVIHGMAERSKAELELHPLPDSSGLTYTAQMLEKYLGPNSPELTQDRVKHVPLSDATLHATFFEFDIPTPHSFPHGLQADNHGNGWFDEFDVAANRIGKLDFESGEITEYPFPLADAAPIAPIVDKDGKVWMCLRHDKKLAYLDPATGQVTIMTPKIPAARKGAFDRDGNFWGSGGDGIYVFNKATQKVQDYPGQIPNEIPQETHLGLTRLPGGSSFYDAGVRTVPLSGVPTVAGSYEPAIDSKGRVWYPTYELGTLNRVDVETGKTTAFKFPGIPASRGITIDSKDNIWYSDVFGYKLVKFDQKTEQAKLYQPPTQYASPYGVVAEKNGNIWFADYTGNNITRFDPKTEQFTEYPIPTRSAMPRFISVDDQGRVWFTEWWQNKIGVLVPTGSPKRTASPK